MSIPQRRIQAAILRTRDPRNAITLSSTNLGYRDAPVVYNHVKTSWSATISSWQIDGVEVEDIKWTSHSGFGRHEDLDTLPCTVCIESANFVALLQFRWIIFSVLLECSRDPKINPCCTCDDIGKVRILRAFYERPPLRGSDTQSPRTLALVVEEGSCGARWYNGGCYVRTTILRSSMMLLLTSPHEADLAVGPPQLRWILDIVSWYSLSFHWFWFRAFFVLDPHLLDLYAHKKGLIFLTTSKAIFLAIPPR